MAFHIMILCGGEGTRLWPVSRRNMPKQFAPLMDSTSLFDTTVARAADLDPASLVVVTSTEQEKLCRQHKSDRLPFVIKAEPIGRNTLPAVIYGCAHLADEDIVLVMPCDHLIRDIESLGKAAEAAVALAESGYIATFGIRPTYPATGFGYIQKGVALGDKGFRADRFLEKPDHERAQVLVRDGGYFWNSGMFAFSAGTLRAEVTRYQPQLTHLFDMKEGADPDVYGAVKSLSFDYGIAELSDRMALIPVDFDWNDLGSWKSLWEELAEGERALATNAGTVLYEQDCRNLLVYSDRGTHKVYAAVGLEGMAVVDTADAMLITPLDRCQEVKHLRERVAGDRPLAVVQPTLEQRPWGFFEILQEGENYKVKRLVVDPGNRLSLQSHYHRNEHWVVVRGTATVVNGEHKFELETGGSTFIPVRNKHRLANFGTDQLEIIEVQTGDYLGEDDIVRYQDDFARIPDPT
ncbi:MAG: mannose-1-phosphate guanylyltransferase/mannose-6-phosphate isomerase [Acidobacteriota bacterium]|nr:mannose-1-phosphate guanylyltransferase/mannose-6-phosphate isomerase [Acidobacteriota bacterium]